MWFLLLLLISCSAGPVRQDINLEQTYRHDFQIEVEPNLKGKSLGEFKTEEGLLAVPKADHYQIDLETKGRMDLLLIESCHRQIPIERSHGLFDNGKSYSFEFEPVAGLEDQPGCPLHFVSIEEGKGRIAWGFLDFGSGEGLAAKIACNGNESVSTGVAVCQSEAGLVQKFSFKEKVVVASRPLGCQLEEPEDMQNFLVKLPLGECVHVFEGLDSSKRLRLTTVGYKEVLIRKD